MNVPRFPIIICLLFAGTCYGQQDSSVKALQQLPGNYFSIIDGKIDKYDHQVTSKTEKTLQKLAGWEIKIHNLLLKSDPVAAEKLFGKDQVTFELLLQKVKDKEALSEQYTAQYDGYRDKVTTNLKYLQAQKENINGKLLQPLENTNKKMQELNNAEDRSAALQQLIKERKQQLISGSIQYIGNSKYLTSINKESWYYIETLKNYKEVFDDPKKTEQTAMGLIEKVPGFQSFFKKNSMLASMFKVPDNYGSTASLAGLQTRASVQSLIQDRVAGGGQGAMQQISQNVDEAESALSKYKDKLLNTAIGNGGGDLPDFQPNMEKTKTFSQRIELGSNFQFASGSNFLPATTDIGLSIGYKFDNHSTVGIGASYKMGMGSLQHISLSNQGVSLRSFLDYKIKRQFYVTGGMELNYLSALPNNSTIERLYNNSWQESGLMGISKKIAIRTKWFKETKLQLLYDFLSQQHFPVSQPIVFRMGYNL